MCLNGPAWLSRWTWLMTSEVRNIISCELLFFPNLAQTWSEFQIAEDTPSKPTSCCIFSLTLTGLDTRHLTTRAELFLRFFRPIFTVFLRFYGFTIYLEKPQ